MEKSPIKLASSVRKVADILFPHMLNEEYCDYKYRRKHGRATPELVPCGDECSCYYGAWQAATDIVEVLNEEVTPDTEQAERITKETA